MSNAIYMSQQTPSFYKTTELQTYKPRSPVWTQQSKVPRVQPLKDSGVPSVHHYKPNDMIKSERTQTTRILFDKEKKESMINKLAARKTFVPGPGKYDITKADQRITIGARRSYK